MMATTSENHVRALVKDCVHKGMFSTAIFYADVLVSLSQGAPRDVYTLAQLYYTTRQFRRAVHLLQREDVGCGSDPHCRYLMAKCLVGDCWRWCVGLDRRWQMECKEWEECLRVLEETEDNGMQVVEAGQVEEAAGIGLRAALCLLKGQVYEAVENRREAVAWYKEALKRDAQCYEAFERLIDRDMLTSQEEIALLESMTFSQEDAQWLQAMYACKLKKVSQQPGICAC